ncbi:hypothetical protein K438DRAFT_2009125 [Mycena galopus ATCC 62051]|nr:hypothetical protein K438DRAFT_2009125 [Mycena galopus ATCC 62051]
MSYLHPDSSDVLSQLIVVHLYKTRELSIDASGRVPYGTFDLFAALAPSRRFKTCSALVSQNGDAASSGDDGLAAKPARRVPAFRCFFAGLLTCARATRQSESIFAAPAFDYYKFAEFSTAARVLTTHQRSPYLHPAPERNSLPEVAVSISLHFAGASCVAGRDEIKRILAFFEGGVQDEAWTSRLADSRLGEARGVLRTRGFERGEAGVSGERVAKATKACRGYRTTHAEHARREWVGGCL